MAPPTTVRPSTSEVEVKEPKITALNWEKMSDALSGAANAEKGAELRAQVRSRRDEKVVRMNVDLTGVTVDPSPWKWDYSLNL
jgi:hypothetical protein